MTIPRLLHPLHTRPEGDYYVTPPEAVQALLDCGAFAVPTNVWECACGSGNISRYLESIGIETISTDLYDRGYGESGVDFLTTARPNVQSPIAIITNPPYLQADAFTLHALEIMRDGDRYIALLPITRLGGQARYREIYSLHPPTTIYCLVRRIYCAPLGDATSARGSSAVNYAWYEWTMPAPQTSTIKWITYDPRTNNRY